MEGMRQVNFSLFCLHVVRENLVAMFAIEYSTRALHQLLRNALMQIYAGKSCEGDSGKQIRTSHTIIDFQGLLLW